MTPTKKEKKNEQLNIISIIFVNVGPAKAWIRQFNWINLPFNSDSLLKSTDKVSYFANIPLSKKNGDNRLI